MTTTTIAIGVGRRSRRGGLLEVDVRSGDGDLDLSVGLGAVVDGRGRHCDMEEGLLVRQEISD